MISINLLDYEQGLKKVAMQKIIINAIGAVLFFIFLMVGYWCFQKIEIRYRANELKQLEGQVRGLTTETTKIQSMKLQAKRTKKIIKKINELRANQFQVTQILEDLILPVPDEIWLTSVRQLGVKEVKGKKIPLILIGDPKKMRSEKKSNKSNNKVRSKQEFLEAVVVYSEQEAADKGLEIDQDDEHAAFGKEDFALLIHGTQPKGSASAAALKEVKRLAKLASA